MRNVRLFAVVVAAGFLFGCAASSPPKSQLSSDAAVTPYMTRALSALQSAYGARGGIAVLVRGGQRWRVAVGTADSHGTPTRPEMTFRIASITKPFTAVVALEAVATHDIALDEYLSPLLGGVLRSTPPVTLRQALAHTSGIFDETNYQGASADVSRLNDPVLRKRAQYLLAQARAGRRIVVPADILIAGAETHRRLFKPGSSWSYTNVGYQAAAEAVSAATHRSYEQWLRTAIITPLGLKHTSVAPPTTTDPQFRGYSLSRTGGAPVDVTSDLTMFGNGASGGIISTVDDLATFAVALMKGRLLPPATVTSMATLTKQSIDANSPYGMGLATYGLACGHFVGHAGGVNGTASIMMVDRKGERAVVAVINARGPVDPDVVGLADDLLCKTP